MVAMVSGESNSASSSESVDPEVVREGDAHPGDDLDYIERRGAVTGLTRRRRWRRAARGPAGRDPCGGAWPRGSATSAGWRRRRSARGPTTCTPSLRSALTLAGLFVSRRTLGHPEVREHVARDLVAARVVGQAEQAVGVDRVVAVRLQRVGANLVGETDASALLPQVEDGARTRRGRPPPSRRRAAPCSRT